MYKVTKRGWFVLGMLTTLAIWALVWISANFWWTEQGICLGSAAECLIAGL